MEIGLRGPRGVTTCLPLQASILTVLSEPVSTPSSQLGFVSYKQMLKQNINSGMQAGGGSVVGGRAHAAGRCLVARRRRRRRARGAAAQGPSRLHAWRGGEIVSQDCDADLTIDLCR